jgi:hypothetical protein
VDWKRLLVCLTGSVDQELLVRNEYLVTENRILRQQITGRVRLSDSERKTSAELGKKLARKALVVLTPVSPVVPGSLDGRGEGMINCIRSRSGVVQGSRGPLPTADPSPLEAVAVGRTVGTVSPWRRAPDLKHLIALHQLLPEPRRQALGPVSEFGEGTLMKRAVCRLAHHHHRLGAIDGDDLDDAPCHSGFRAARQMLGMSQTLNPGDLPPDGMVSSVVGDGRHPLGP